MTKDELTNIYNIINNYNNIMKFIIEERVNYELENLELMNNKLHECISYCELLTNQIVIHDSIINLKPLSTSKEYMKNIDLSKLKDERILISENNEIETFIKNQINNESTIIVTNQLLNEWSIRYIFNANDDKLSEFGNVDNILKYNTNIIKDYFKYISNNTNNIPKTKFLIFYLLGGLYNQNFELTKLAELIVKNRYVDKKNFSDQNLGFDDFIINEGGKQRKYIREKKVKELLGELVSPNEKNVDLLKL